MAIKVQGTTVINDDREIQNGVTLTPFYSYGDSVNPIVFTVTVDAKTSGHPYSGVGSGNGYSINGIEAPALKLSGADPNAKYVYRFDQSDASNSGHPLRIYEDPDKTTEYTTGVTTSGTPGSSGAYTQIEVDRDTPSLLYYMCEVHNFMGNYVTSDVESLNTSQFLRSDTNDTMSGDLTVTGNIDVSQILLSSSGGSRISSNTSTNNGENIQFFIGNSLEVSITDTKIDMFSELEVINGGIIANGNITATGDITANFSDDRLKTRLGTIDSALNKVDTLEGFYYEPNETAESYGYEKERRVGLSAQDVQEVLPEVVRDAPIGDGYLTLQYEQIVPLLVEAIKELKIEVDNLRKKI